MFFDVDEFRIFRNDRVNDEKIGVGHERQAFFGDLRVGVAADDDLADAVRDDDAGRFFDRIVVYFEKREIKPDQ